MPESFIEYFSQQLKSKPLLLNKGEMLFQQGDEVTHFFYIKTGKIKLFRNTIEGSTVVIYAAHSGETLAEPSLFSDKYHCSAVTESGTEVESFRKPDLLKLFAQNPAAMQRLLFLLAQQVRELRTLNEIKNIHSAKQRILAYIQSEVDNNKELFFSLSLKDIAHKIGLAHETFYRELKKLEQSKQITRYKRHIKLL
ncbi:MAG: Crp/Fnr family transcriptional regulator [Pseudomonadota bacterium]